MPRFNRPLRRPGPMRPTGNRRPFGSPRPLAPGPIRALANANRLFAEGQFQPAAAQFEMLAQAASTGSLPFAPRLFYQAARANWRIGQIPKGMQLLRTGLGILLTAGAAERARQIASSAAEELNRLGHPVEAAEVGKFLSEIPGSPAAGFSGTGMDREDAAASPAEPAHPVLPASCPKCGALVRTDEIEWIDPQTAECAYCGTPIRPEEK
jgi:hypothetical protein